MNKIKFAAVTSIILVLSVLTIIFTNEQTNPAASIELGYDFDQIKSRASKLVPEFGFEVEDYQIQPKFEIDKKIVKQAQTTFGIEKANEILKLYPKAYYWEAIWTSENNTAEQRKGPIIIIDDIDDEKKISMQFDLNGKLIGLSNYILDSSEIKEITEEEGLKILEQFINNYTPIKKFDKNSIYKTEKNERRTISHNKTVKKDNKIITENISGTKQFDYNFASFNYAFSYKDSLLGNQVNVNAELYGNKITKFSMQIEVPEEYKNSNYDLIPKISNVVIYILLIIFLTFISFKRIRNYEVNFKSYIPIGIISALALALEIFLSSNIEIRWEMLIPLIIAPLFYFIFIIFIWTISESYVREHWKDKSITFDLIRNGYAGHSLISKSILSGISAGFLILALINLSIFFADKIFNIYIFPFDQDNPLINSRFPAMLLFSNTVYGIFTTIPVILLTLPSIIKSRIKNKWIFLAIFAVLGIFAKNAFFFPWEIGLITSFMLFAIIGFLIINIDFLAASIAYFSVSFFSQLINIYTVQPAQLGSVYFFIVIFTVLYFVYLLLLFRKDKVTDFEKITPQFAKYISERQRLQGELDVARKVQMSFLPSKNPKFDSLDIASECIPALEVGGDYYDFISYDKNKLGVVIGDVTGKGTKAAFYMTLTKGFLKAIAKHKTEPAEILKDINEVFYENVERGNFISMAFALFDINKKSVKIARAGHNPILVKKSNSSEIRQIQTKGIAIGLEKGEIFSKSIQTEEIFFESGDVFIFYTDGIPEAMNKTNEEYGMKKFEQVIQNEGNSNSAEIMNSIYKNVRLFTKNVPQSDDMTCVIVKIT